MTETITKQQCLGALCDYCRKGWFDDLYESGSPEKFFHIANGQRILCPASKLRLCFARENNEASQRADAIAERLPPANSPVIGLDATQIGGLWNDYTEARFFCRFNDLQPDPALQIVAFARACCLISAAVKARNGN